MAEREWWHKTVIYQVYLSSFKDGNDDGIGDIPGLISKLDYFDYLQVPTLLLSPFYPSPMKDNGFDISNYLDIDPSFGCMDDFVQLITKAKKMNLNILLNFVPNHTSDQHEWFTKSVNKIGQYNDYYVWVDPKDGLDGYEPPNNWVSVFGGSAWTWNEKRHQYYLHQFLPEQPDLNLRNSHVRNELKKVLTFWLEKGVDGFRVDAASHLYENMDLLDEPVAPNTLARADEYDYLDHIYTKGQPENFDILKEWRIVLEEYSVKMKYKVLLTETYEDFDSTMRYYGTSATPLSDIPLNWDLVGLNKHSSARDLYAVIFRWNEGVPFGKHLNWVLGSHDSPRLASRVGSELLDGIHMVTLLMHGIPICYYGDELAMENVTVCNEDMRDSFAIQTSPENSRDACRTPMQWSSERNAGFTSCVKPWLPIHGNFSTVNVEVETLSANSHLQIFQKLLQLRLEPAIQNGIEVYPIVTDTIFSMARVLPEQKSFLVILNMGVGTCDADLTKASDYLPEFANVEITNQLHGTGEVFCDKKDLRMITLQPKEAMVLYFTAKNGSTLKCLEHVTVL